MSQTRVSQTIIFLGDEADDISLDVHDGHLTIGLGMAASIGLDLSSEAALAKLAEAAQKALRIVQLRNALAVAS